MVLAPQRGQHYRCQKRERSYKEWSDRSVPISFKGVDFGVIFKSCDSNSSAVNSGSTIGPGGVAGAHTLTPINSKSSDIFDVNIAGVVTPRSCSRPGTDTKVLSGEGEGPAGVKINNISPSDRYLLQRIGDHNALVVESNFWTYQEGIDAGENRSSDADTDLNRSGVALVEARPDKEPAHRHTYSGKDQVGARAVGIGVIHPRILSQDSSKALHSAKAVC